MAMTFDECQEDYNNGQADVCEILNDPSLDCTGQKHMRVSPRRLLPSAGAAPVLGLGRRVLRSLGGTFRGPGTDCDDPVVCQATVESAANARARLLSLGHVELRGYGWQLGHGLSGPASNDWNEAVGKILPVNTDEPLEADSSTGERVTPVGTVEMRAEIPANGPSGGGLPMASAVLEIFPVCRDRRTSPSKDRPRPLPVAAQGEPASGPCEASYAWAVDADGRDPLESPLWFRHDRSQR